MYTTHGHWFPPEFPGEQPPAMVARCGGPALCPQCARECHAPLPAVLSSPTPAASSSQSASAPLSVSIDGLRDWYQRFLELKDAESKIKDMLTEARDMLMAPINAQPQLKDLKKVDLSIGGRPVLQVRRVEQTRVDTKRLKSEDPATAKRFSVTSTQESLNIL